MALKKALPSTRAGHLRFPVVKGILFPFLMVVFHKTISAQLSQTFLPTSESWWLVGNQTTANIIGPFMSLYAYGVLMQGTLNDGKCTALLVQEHVVCQL